MAKMTVDEFIKRANALKDANNIYMMGMFGQVLNKSNVEAKRKQYPNWYKDKDFSSYYGKNYRGYDCVCFVKAVLWGGTPSKLGTYASNGVPDIDTEQMYANCTNKCKPSEAKKGYLLHMYNHVGVYLGDGKVIECSNGCIRVTSLSYQKWTGAGKLPYLDYGKEDEPKKQTKIKTGDVVQISKGAIYGGLAKTRGTKVPDWVTEKKYKILQTAIHLNDEEALLDGIWSWVSLKYLYK